MKVRTYQIAINNGNEVNCLFKNDFCEAGMFLTVFSYFRLNGTYCQGRGKSEGELMAFDWLTTVVDMRHQEENQPRYRSLKDAGCRRFR